MIWKIALGVFLGMVVFVLATCTFLGMGAKVALDAQQAAYQEALQKSRQANERARADFRAQQQRQQDRRDQLDRNAQEAARPAANERCISGQRFRRVENGWEQVGSCS